MLVENLIKKLQEFPTGTNVCLYDWRKNLGDDIGDGSTSGIYPEFDIEMHTLEADEAEFFKEQHDRDFVPCISLRFDNDDYNDNGELVQ